MSPNSDSQKRSESIPGDADGLSAGEVRWLLSRPGSLQSLFNWMPKWKAPHARHLTQIVPQRQPTDISEMPPTGFRNQVPSDVLHLPWIIHPLKQLRLATRKSRTVFQYNHIVQPNASNPTKAIELLEIVLDQAKVNVNIVASLTIRLLAGLAR